MRANDSLQCVPSRRMLPLVALVILSTLGPARAAPYTVSLDFVDESSSEPLHRERSVELPPSTIDQRVYAGPGGVALYQQLETLFYVGWSTVGSTRSWARSEVTDLVITGPPGSGPVSGTL